MSKRNIRQGVDDFAFEGIDGTDVFFGVFKPGVYRDSRWVMYLCELLDFVHRQNVFLKLLAVDHDNHSLAWVPQEDFIFGRFYEHLQIPRMSEMLIH